MRKINMLKLIAVFLMTLVISLPVAFAASVSIVQYSGGKGVEGYVSDTKPDSIGVNDVLTLKVEATPDKEDGFNEKNVTVNGKTFASCSPIQGTQTFTCIYEADCAASLGGAGCSWTPLTLSVNLINDAGSVIDSDSKSLSVDGEKPVITIKSASQKKAEKGSIVEVDLSVEDKGSPASGLKQIDFYKNVGGVETIIKEASITEDILLFTPKYEESKLQFPYSGESFRLVVKATDRLDNLGTVIYQNVIEVDSKAPAIRSDSFKVIDIETKQPLAEGQYLSSKPKQVQIFIGVEEEGISLDKNAAKKPSEFVNLVKLTSTALQLSEVKPNVCNPTDKGVECIWQTFLQLTKDTNFDFKFSAADPAGNIAAPVPKNINLKLATQAPTLDEITIDDKYCKSFEDAEGKKSKVCYFKKGGKYTLKAKFSGVQAGVDADKIYLDLSQLYPIKFKDVVVPASSCNPGSAAGTFECTWQTEFTEVEAASDASVRFMPGRDRITQQIGFSQDRAGNTIVGETTFVADNEAPKIVSIKIEEIGGKKEEKEKEVEPKPEETVEITGGSNIRIEAIVSDDTDVEMAISGLDAFGFDGEYKNIGCKQEEGLATRWKCEWESSAPVPNEAGLLKEEIKFKFTDLVGNVADSTNTGGLKRMISVNPTLSTEELAKKLGKSPEELVEGGFWSIMKNSLRLSPSISGDQSIGLAVRQDLVNVNWPMTVTFTLKALGEVDAPFGEIEFEGCEGKDAVSQAAYEAPPKLEEKAEEADTDEEKQEIIQKGSFTVFNLVANNNEFTPTIYFFLKRNEFKDVNELSFTCKFSIASRVKLPDGTIATTQQAETEEVDFVVKFAKGQFDSLNQELEEKIDELRDRVKFIGKSADVLEAIAETAELICLGVKAGYAAGLIINEANRATDTARATVVGKPAATAACIFAGAGVKFVAETPAKTAGKWCNFITCQGENEVLKKFGDPGTAREFGLNPRDNLFVAMGTMCIPGIVYNYQKVANMLCREIHCLENFVADGTATIADCSEARKYDVCQYVTGQFTGAAFGIAYNLITRLVPILGEVLQFVNDPIGFLVSYIPTFTCSAIFCAGSSNAASTCITVSSVIQIGFEFFIKVREIQYKEENNYCEKIGLGVI